MESQKYWDMANNSRVLSYLKDKDCLIGVFQDIFPIIISDLHNS